MTSISISKQTNADARGLASSMRKVASTVASELSALALMGAGLAIFLARLGQASAGNGARLLLFNSDSLTMPLFARALSAPEGLGWTSGPFLGIFPELPTYLLADWLTSTPRSALIGCGILNILFLYLAMRLLATACGGSVKIRRQGAVAGIMAVILGMAAETFSSSEWNLGWMLFSSTYYVGVSTMGVVTVALVARMLIGSRRANVVPNARSATANPASINKLPPLKLSVSLLFVSLFTTISNPMFSVVVAIPCTAAVIVFLFSRRCSGAPAGVALGSLLFGTALGYVLQPGLGMVGTSVEGYFHFDRIGRTAAMVAAMAKTLLHNPFGAFELVTLLILVGMALWRTTRIVLQRTSAARDFAARDFAANGSGTKDSATGRHFVSFFVASWIILAPVALIITGPGVTRYFGSFAVFPFLMLVANYSVFAEKFSRAKFRRVIALPVGLIAVVGFGSFSSAQATANLAAPEEIACVSATVPRGSSGIAEFWTARPIDIFNTAGARVLQVSPELGVSGWISNPAEFKGRDFTFVLTSWNENYKRIRPITAETVAPLGVPSRVTHCGELDVYEYRAGTPGHKLLNAGLRYPAS